MGSQPSCCVEETPPNLESITAAPMAEEVPPPKAKVEEPALAPAPDAPKEDVAPKENVDPKAVPVTFMTEDGQEFSVVFTKRPWGIDFFAKTVPMKVRNVYGNAKELGVKEGMAIAKVDGETLPGDIPGAIQKMKDAALKLGPA